MIRRDEDEHYAPPVDFPRTGNAWTDYVNDARVRNGKAPIVASDAESSPARRCEDAPCCGCCD
jgi:hypothetical protein